LIDAFMLILIIFGLFFVAGSIVAAYFSKSARELKKLKDRVVEIPTQLLKPIPEGVRMGDEIDLKIPIYLPDSIRSRHIHIIGATGSGKTESVILNFLRQDVTRGLGTIILDAKGDKSFIESLRLAVPENKLFIFDLGSESSLTYNPLEVGSALESAQRLFSSLIWSEEYYKSKALSALQRLFQNHREKFDSNPTLMTLSNYLSSAEEFNKLVSNKDYPKNAAEKDFLELSGLRDQIRTLSTGHLAKTLSPTGSSQMQLSEAAKGNVLYFRLQSLMSPQLVTTLGRLLINHLNYLAGTSHRDESKTPEGAKNEAKLIPIYMDEFASFACPEFGDLISKARSAGLALHFSHQSIGDLVEVSEGFLSRVTDNSATKIVMRINDPDSADFFARAFGTQMYQKITQRLINSKDADTAEMLGEGSVRDAHQFRASPDLLKTLPTGVGAVLVAHGYDSPHGASTVFKIRFPELDVQKTPLELLT
jgi:DNA helicase HerA-like ATPase